jgi:glycogen debranching enzyme
MADQLVILNGSTFLLSDTRGDVAPGDQPNGFFYADMRHLSTWLLRVNGAPLTVLTSRPLDYHAARIVGTLADARVGVNPVVSVRRDRYVDGGVHEDVIVENHSDREQRLSIEMEFAADFADLFEVKDRRKKRGRSGVNVGDDEVELWYEHRGYQRATNLLLPPGGEIDARHVRYELTLAPRASWQGCFELAAVADGMTMTAPHKELGMDEPDPAMSSASERRAGGSGERAQHVGNGREQGAGRAAGAGKERAVGAVRATVDVPGGAASAGRPASSMSAAHPQPMRSIGRYEEPTAARLLAEAPALASDWDALRHAYLQGLTDLAALRFRPTRDLTWSLPAAGMPWFMALFGRDSILASYQALPFSHHFAVATLRALAEFQATAGDDFRDAQPGKILHELRRGELAATGDAPQSPYYGAHDTTALWLILLDEYERWTGDTQLVRHLEPNARAALDWIETSGDPDGDGYLEYQTRSSKGLGNQCWKDSGNSMLFADGRQAETPIATCEIQGYAYDARRRLARLAREIWGDEALAQRLERDAAALRERFNRDFWNEERGHYVLALDGQKRQVDSLTSNTGQLLWSGIVDEARAPQVVARLMGPGLFSGWGVRTMSTGDAGYNPIEYHNGTVWPHDTSLIAEGMRRYGFRDEAARLGRVLIAAASFFGHRLPEVFAGFDRERTLIPIEYPTACSPQAWAAGAPLLVVRTVLGLDAAGGELRTAPHLPEDVQMLRLAGVRVHGHVYDVSATAAPAGAEVRRVSG